jgi:putative transposase
LFFKDEDYEAFEAMIEETVVARPMRVCAYCLMPNHWHFVLWPEQDGDLADFMQCLTSKHVRRWQLQRDEVGTGHVYQGRYKSFPVESDEHFYQVVRYVERNALRAGLVQLAEDWKWSSLWRWLHGSGDQQKLLSAWPVPRPSDWAALVNSPQSEAEVEAIRRCVNRGCPLGSDGWVRRTAERLGLQSTLRSRRARPGQ